jgi:hypothetical protein
VGKGERESHYFMIEQGHSSPVFVIKYANEYQGITSPIFGLLSNGK